MKNFLRVYHQTLILGALMTAYIATTIAWGTSTLAACIVAATVIITQYGSDTWKERATRP